MGQTTKHTIGPRRDGHGPEILALQVEPTRQHRMDHRDVRVPLLPAGNGGDLGLGMAQSNFISSRAE